MNLVTNQHGDVIFKKVNNIPENSKKIKIKPEFVVEKGEGVHTHTIKNVKNLGVYISNGDMYLNVLKELEINHEEHGTQTIKPGIYKKEIERQFDYEKEVERSVVD